jgi:hypothetical protein
MLSMAKRFLTAPFGRSSSQPANGTYDCQNMPQSLTAAGLSNKASGILMTFVPPGADYSSVSQAWQRFLLQP